MTFYEWLLKQLDRDDPIGDVARDAKDDTWSQKEEATLNQWKTHIRTFGCREATEAFQYAAGEYNQWARP